MRATALVVLPLACACSPTLEGAGTVAEAKVLGASGVLVVEASTEAGAIEAILPGTHRLVRIDGVGLGKDMQLRRLLDPAGRERLFTLHAELGVVVERARDGTALARHEVWDRAKAPSSANPLDLAYARDGSLWISRAGEPSLVVVAPDGRQSLVDLSAFADDDGLPDMSAIAIVGDVAYVALRRLEKGLGTRKHRSFIVAVDVKTRAASLWLELPVKDPGARFVAQGGALWISCIGGPLGDFESSEPDTTAGLVRLDLGARTASVVLGAERGFVTAFDLADAKTGYAIVAEFGADNPTSVVRFDPTSGAVTATWARTAKGYLLWDLAALRTEDGRGLLLVADRTEEAPGLRVLSTDDGARVGFVPTRLPPVQLTVLRSPSATTTDLASVVR